MLQKNTNLGRKKIKRGKLLSKARTPLSSILLIMVKVSPYILKGVPVFLLVFLAPIPLLRLRHIPFDKIISYTQRGGNYSFKAGVNNGQGIGDV
jgi:hypothetical protein